MQTFHQGNFSATGLPVNFVQDNHSGSAHGVLRGLHFQYPQWQGKLIRTINGEIFDVAVDIRVDSPTCGQWVGVYLSADNKQQLYVPPGYAHGFCVTSEFADVIYKCTSLYKPVDDKGIRWDDSDIGVEWPISGPVVSEKDQAAGRLADLYIRL